MIKRTYATDYILPFLFKDNKLFCKKNGFVNAFVNDINRPFLENKIILVFRYNPNVYLLINKIMTKNENFYDHKELHIKGKLYDEFIFTIPQKHKTEILEIIEGNSFILPYKSKGKILAFWNDMTSQHMLELLKTTFDIKWEKTKSLHKLKEWVPEEDILEEDNLLSSLYLGGEKAENYSQPLFYQSSSSS